MIIFKFVYLRVLFCFQFLKKLNRQERVVEEVKLVLKPHYNKKRINKEEYKDILRRAVPKVSTYTKSIIFFTFCKKIVLHACCFL